MLNSPFSTLLFIYWNLMVINAVEFKVFDWLVSWKSDLSFCVDFLKTYQALFYGAIATFALLKTFLNLFTNFHGLYWIFVPLFMYTLTILLQCYFFKYSWIFIELSNLVIYDIDFCKQCTEVLQVLYANTPNNIYSQKYSKISNASIELSATFRKNYI